MKRLLITGAHGFIGRHCLRPALESGFEVHAILNSRPAPDGILGQLPVMWHRVDLLAPHQGEALIDEICPSHILHAGWVTAHDEYWESPLNFGWVIASMRLARAFGSCANRQRLVTVGSCGEYDWNNQVITENVTAESPRSPHGEAKLLAHRATEVLARRLAFSACFARLFFVYGPYEDRRRLIPRACLNFAAGKPFEFASRRAIRDFLHVEDAGRALIALLDSDVEGPCNVCSADPLPIAYVIEILAEISGARHLARIGALPDCPEDPLVLAGDNHRLRRTGWEPSVSLLLGLARTFAWWEPNVLRVNSAAAPWPAASTDQPQLPSRLALDSNNGRAKPNHRQAHVGRQ
jgi:UDP-glucose 4-epimerase